MIKYVYGIFIVSFISLNCSCKLLEKKPVIGNEKILWAASWSNDGNYVAFGGNHNKLRVLSAKDYQIVKEIPFENTITKLSWHPTENLLAFVTQAPGSKITILDLDTGVLHPVPSSSGLGGRAIVWHPKGDLLAAGDNDGQISIYQKNGDLVKRVKTEQKTITGLDWHPTDNIIATVGKEIAIYDLDQDQLTAFASRDVPVLMLCVRWHPSGDFFVTGDYGDFIENYPPLLQFWDKSGQHIRAIEKSKAEYRNLEWSADGKFLATASEALRIWTSEGQLISTGKSKTLLWGLDWSPDQQRLISSSEFGEVIFWDNKAKKVKQFNFE